MKQGLVNLAAGILEMHKSTADTREMLKTTRLAIQAAYDLGRVDALKEQQAEAIKAREGAKPAANPSGEPPKPEAPASVQEGAIAAAQAAAPKPEKPAKAKAENKPNVTNAEAAAKAISEF